MIIKGLSRKPQPKKEAPKQPEIKEAVIEKEEKIIEVEKPVKKKTSSKKREVIFDNQIEKESNIENVLLTDENVIFESKSLIEKEFLTDSEVEDLL